MQTTTTKLSKVVTGLFRDFKPIKDIEKVKKELYSLSPLKADVNKKIARQDKRSHTLVYESTDPSSVPDVLSSLLSICRKEVEAEENFSYRIQYIASMFRSNIEVSSPAINVACRFLFNVGYGEVYELSRESVNRLDDILEKHIGGNTTGINRSQMQNMLQEQIVFVPADQMLKLGSGYVCDYTLRVRGTPPKEKPQTFSASRKPQPSQPFLRYPGQKIMVIIDLITENEELEDTMEKITDNLMNIDKREIYKMGTEITDDSRTAKEKMSTTKTERKEVARMMNSD